ncbi:MAG: hypothetical protein NTW87_05615 [Planctomycetota bacterium]|nr:hypothetical protein [Planctomycetota bacterium]
MLWPDDIDKRFNWPPGRARRLALQGKLPHYRLPDGSLRFEVEEVEALVKHVPVTPDAGAVEARGREGGPR